MTSVLLTASFILHLISLFAIVLLYLRQNRLVGLEKNQKQLKKELEEFFSGCILEFKEENERFITMLQNTEKDEASKGNSRELSVKKELAVEQDETIEERAVKKESQKRKQRSLLSSSNRADPESAKGPAGNVYQAVHAYKQTPKPAERKVKPLKTSERSGAPAPRRNKEPVEKEKNSNTSDLYIESLLNQALLLKKQGYSLDEIAKRLNKGKTEIELLFKFRQKG